MDLREYLNILKNKGKLLEINKEVDWKLEAACIGSMSLRVGKGRYGLLFNKIKGYDEGRITTGIFCCSPRNRPWEMTSTLLQLPEDTPRKELREEIRRRWSQPIRPIEVAPKEARCKEVVKLGKEVNIFQFPVPLVHGNDGGRYLTNHAVITKDPDTGWVNWGTYRFEFLGPRKGSGLFTPGQHMASMYYNKYEPRGQDMPYAIAIGGDPLIFYIGSTAVPYGISEPDIIGALRQEPVEVVRCETNDLLAPANAEIVIEGVVKPHDRVDEGPFAEYTGFTHGRILSPVYTVNCVTYRRNPIVPLTIAGMMLDDSPYVNETISPLSLEEYLADLNIPVTDTGMLIHAGGLMLPLSVDPQTPQHTYELAHAYLGWKYSLWFNWGVMLDPDIEPVDPRDVFEEIGLNVDPRNMGVVAADWLNTPLHFQTSLEERQKGIHGAKIVLDATTKFREPGLVPKKAVYEIAFPPDVRERVKKRWEKFGFDQPMAFKPLYETKTS